MRQFASVLGWEVAYYLRRVSTWIYFGIYATIGFIFMLLSGGAFREAAAVFGGGGKVLANSPYALASLEPTIALFGMSIVAAVAGNALYRDYDGASFFIGDPVAYGYDGPKHASSGHHPVSVGVVAGAHYDPDDVEYCYLDGPHYHYYAPAPNVK